ncbi:hypothetical protein KP509_19G027100 [Ceratopteris richardii]|nr:hypothetical protein KP509_19G027100 [Ceratopteris richardii]
MKDCAPLDEESFKPVIKENYFGRNKFRCELSEEQVDNLIKIFRPLDARGLTKPKFVRDVKLGTRQKTGGALHKGFSAGGVGSAGRNVAGKIRQLPPEYATSDPYVRSAYPDIARLDSDVLYAPKTDHLYAPKVEALERRPYVLDPLVESSLRPLGVRGEWIQRRIPEGFYSDDRLLPITRAEYAYDLPYPRDVLYDSRDRALYRPIAGLPLAYP